MKHPYKNISFILFILLLVLSVVYYNLQRVQRIDTFINTSMITFIIPTIGRDTLSRSIESLKNQTNPNWNAIVIFDGIAPTIQESDPRIRILEIDKHGQSVNSAGLVRNKGMKLVETPWIGFLDDDDLLDEKYVDTFLKEISEYSHIDVLIFRMMSDKREILPPLNDSRIVEGNVGISFAIKRELFIQGYEFVPSHIEDYIYLSKLLDDKKKIMISPYVMYYVRERNNTTAEGERKEFN